MRKQNIKPSNQTNLTLQASGQELKTTPNINKNAKTQPTDHFFIIGHDLDQGASALRFFTEQVEATLFVSGGIERVAFTVDRWRQNRNASTHVAGLTANTQKLYNTRGETSIATLQGS